MHIECTDCAMYRSEHCSDCLVTALLHPDEDAVDIDESLEPSIGALAEAGLIPVLRFRPREPEAPRGASDEIGSGAEAAS